VEEELLLVDAASFEPRAVAGAVLDGDTQAVADGPGGELVAELQQEQMETNTSPCENLDGLREELRGWRGRASALARAKGVEVAALATSPVAVSPRLTSGERYRWMANAFGITAQEHLTCGCHIHVEVDSDEEGVAVIDRIQPWLAPLLALSANSPFWQGQDTGFAGYRYQVFERWPTAGPPQPFGSAEGYRQAIDGYLATGVMRDEGMMYFDARLSAAYPTVEIRVCDVCSDIDDTVLLAALVRALVTTAARDWAAGRPAPDIGLPLLRLAAWRACRSGLDGPLLHPRTQRPTTAREVVDAIVEYAEAALKEAGDLDTVRAGLDRLLLTGTGARWQRAVYGESGPAEVVREAVSRTLHF
jgi:carboxylate-amine ligase